MGVEGVARACGPARARAWVSLLVALVGCEGSPPAGTGDGGARGPYRVVEGWPALAPGFTTGQVAGLAFDGDEDLWIFARRDRPWFGEPVTATVPSETLVELDRDAGAILSRTGRDRFVVPHGLFIDRAGHAWVTDVGLHAVFELDAAGTVLRTLGTPGERGSDERHFDMPTDVFVDADGTLFVADGYGNARVVAFDARGRFLRAWGRRGAARGELDTPHSITGDAAGLYVADRGNARVQVFSREGVVLDVWQGAELGWPWAVTLSPQGDVYVLDGGDPSRPEGEAARVLRVDRRGRVLEAFGSAGTDPGQFDWPHDLAVSRSGEVFVGEVRNGARVQRFVRAAR